MSSKIEIINIAFHTLGSERVNNLNDDSKRARMAKDLYEVAKSTVLSSGYWDCCLKRIQIVPITPPGMKLEEIEGPYLYNKPADCVLVKQCSDDNYQMIGDKISSAGKLIEIEYVSSAITEGSYSPYLNLAIGYKLASLMCFTITQSEDRQKSVEALFRDALSQGLASSTIDSNETVLEPELPEILTVRRDW